MSERIYTISQGFQYKFANTYGPDFAFTVESVWVEVRLSEDGAISAIALYDRRNGIGKAEYGLSVAELIAALNEGSCLDLRS